MSINEFKRGFGEVLKGAAMMFLLIGFGSFVITLITMPTTKEIFTYEADGVLILLYRLAINVLIPLLLSLVSLLIGKELISETEAVAVEKIVNPIK